MDLTFSCWAETIDAYDFVEITARIAAHSAANPFTDGCLRGEFTLEGAAPASQAVTAPEVGAGWKSSLAPNFTCS
jgi:hypothetical protein